MLITRFHRNGERRSSLLRVAALVTLSIWLCVPLPAQRAATPELEQFLAEAVVPPNFALSPQPLSFPPDLMAALAAGTIEIRQRAIYLPSAKTLQYQVFLIDPKAPLPLPSAPPATTPPTISLANMAVDKIYYDTVRKAILFVGAVTSNPVPSPWGDLTGVLAAYSVGYDDATPTNFTFLGISLAGNHAAFAPAGKGLIKFKTAPTPPVVTGPVANAGKNFTAVNRMVKLDGTASTGNLLTYAWRSLGNKAAILGANTATPMVQLSSGKGDYVFELTVTDSNGAQSTATVVVTYWGT